MWFEITQEFNSVTGNNFHNKQVAKRWSNYLQALKKDEKELNIFQEIPEQNEGDIGIDSISMPDRKIKNLSDKMKSENDFLATLVEKHGLYKEKIMQKRSLIWQEIAAEFNHYTERNFDQKTISKRWTNYR